MAILQTLLILGSLATGTAAFLVLCLASDIKPPIGIAAAFGKGDSIPFYRLVQFAYVILASVLAAGVCDLLARQSLSSHEYRNRLLWIGFLLFSLFLLATDPRFNIYTHTLHNDGLALLFSVFAFWLIAKTF